MTWIWLLLIVFVAYLVQAITGFGGALLSLPLVILLVGFDDARLLTTALSLVTGLIVSSTHYRQINKKKLGLILLIMAVGTASGMVLDRLLDARFLILLYGVITVLLAIIRLLPKRQESRSLAPPFLLGILLLAGIMQGLFVAGGAFLMIYAIYEFPDKTEFRATSSAVWGILNIFMMIVYGYSGRINSGNLKLVAICIPVVLAMIFLAEKIQARIKQAVFAKLTNVLLLASGLILLVSY